MAGYLYRNKVPPPGVEPGHVTHPSTNRARRRVTSLIRPTTLPLRHAATRTRAMRYQMNVPVVRNQRKTSQKFSIYAKQRLIQ